jgi:ribosomal protein S18 acetylase RimI-like enzyme
MIRDATPQDFGAIAALNVEAYREFATHMTSTAWKAMHTNVSAVAEVAERATFMVACVTGELAGSVAYCPPGRSNPDIFLPDWASVLLLAVSPRYRGRGIAQQLVEACIRRARAEEAVTIGLFTSELMTTARRLYETLGFQEDGEIPRRHGLRYWRYRLPLGDATQR